jgi:Meckel syndrome type 1 protein
MAAPEVVPVDAAGWRERGNARFKAGAFQEALACYTASVEAAPTCLGFANRAMAALKLGRPADAARDCTAAIAIDPGYVKAYQRRGAARRALGELTAAIEDYESALRLEPANKATAADRRACVEAWMRQQGVSGAEPERVPVVPAPAEGDLLRAVSTTPVAGAPKVAAVAAVQEVAAAELADDGALPPLHALPPAAAPPEVPAAAAPSPPPPTAAAIPCPPASAAGAAPPPPQRALPPPAAPVAPAPKLPRTGVEFERAWKGFKGDAGAQWAYLRAIPPQQLPTLLQQALTPALLGALLSTLLGAAAQQAQQGGAAAAAAALLESLPQVPRFDMNLMSLTAKEKAAAGEAWDAAAGAAGEGEGEGGAGARLAAARARYKL